MNMEYSQQLFYSLHTPFSPTFITNPPDNITIFDDNFLDNMFGSGISFPSNPCTSSLDQDPSLDGNDNNLTLVEGNSQSSEVVKRPKRDRSKTIVSERKRRSKMKEKLYELRSLVPHITKMDKASIIGDAVIYVKSLQDQAKKLQEEIFSLESSSPKEKQAVKLCKKDQCVSKIVNLTAYQVDKHKTYVVIECDKGKGVIEALYSAIESVDLHIDDSNLSAVSDRILMKLSVQVMENKETMDVLSVKLWLTSALLLNGFVF